MDAKSERTARVLSWVGFACANLSLVVAFVDLLRSGSVTWVTASHQLALPVGLSVFATSLLVRPRSEPAANALLALSFVFYIGFFLTRYIG